MGELPIYEFVLFDPLKKQETADPIVKPHDQIGGFLNFLGPVQRCLSLLYRNSCVVHRLHSVRRFWLGQI